MWGNPGQMYGGSPYVTTTRPLSHFTLDYLNGSLVLLRLGTYYNNSNAAQPITISIPIADFQQQQFMQVLIMVQIAQFLQEEQRSILICQIIYYPKEQFNR